MAQQLLKHLCKLIAEESDENQDITLLVLSEMIAIKRAEQNGDIYEPIFDIHKQGGAGIAHFLNPYPLPDLEAVLLELDAEPK
jgi:hypothetical protein